MRGEQCAGESSAGPPTSAIHCVTKEFRSEDAGPSNPAVLLRSPRLCRDDDTPSDPAVSLRSPPLRNKGGTPSDPAMSLRSPTLPDTPAALLSPPLHDTPASERGRAWDRAVRAIALQRLVELQTARQRTRAEDQIDELATMLKQEGRDVHSQRGRLACAPSSSPTARASRSPASNTPADYSGDADVDVDSDVDVVDVVDISIVDERGAAVDDERGGDTAAPPNVDVDSDVDVEVDISVVDLSVVNERGAAVDGEGGGDAAVLARQEYSGVFVVHSTDFGDPGKIADRQERLARIKHAQQRLRLKRQNALAREQKRVREAREAQLRRRDDDGRDQDGCDWCVEILSAISSPRDDADTKPESSGDGVHSVFDDNGASFGGPFVPPLDQEGDSSDDGSLFTSPVWTPAPHGDG